MEKCSPLTLLMLFRMIFQIFLSSCILWYMMKDSKVYRREILLIEIAPSLPISCCVFRLVDGVLAFHLEGSKTQISAYTIICWSKKLRNFPKYILNINFETFSSTYITTGDPHYEVYIGISAKIYNSVAQVIAQIAEIPAIIVWFCANILFVVKTRFYLLANDMWILQYLERKVIHRWKQV